MICESCHKEFPVLADLHIGNNCPECALEAAGAGQSEVSLRSQAALREIANERKPTARYRQLAVAGVVLYLLSYCLPALVSRIPSAPKRVVLWGWQAAAWSLFGFLEGIRGLPLLLSNPSFLLGAALVLGRRRRLGAVVLAISLCCMVGAGVFAPEEATGEMIRVPGGRLAEGYYLWLSAGACLLVSAILSVDDSRTQMKNAA